MRSSVVNLVLSLAWPAVLPLVGAVLWLQSTSAPDAVTALWEVLPLGLFGLAILMGWRFNRSRVVFAALVAGLAFEALRRSPGLEVLPVILAVLIPVNLALVGTMRERGVLSMHGLARIAFLAVQAAAVAWLVAPNQAEMAAVFSAPFVESLPVALGNLHQLALVALLASALLLVWRFVRRRGAIDSALIGVLAAFLFGLHTPADSIVFAVYAATAGLILTLSIVETSHALAYRDELTGLLGRRALNDALRQLGGAYTVAMVDIDKFKRFNDRFGHDIGDQALRMVAGQLSRVGGGGRAYRYGGEEFALLFPGRSIDKVRGSLESVRQAVANARFTVRGRSRPRRKPDSHKPKRRNTNRVRLTVSIGAAERRDRQTPTQTIKAADKKMYKAKRDGRNRVIA
jgi:diguanylate cyclase (GGDEF)-like protein